MNNAEIKEKAIDIKINEEILDSMADSLAVGIAFAEKKENRKDGRIILADKSFRRFIDTKKYSEDKAVILMKKKNCR